MSTSEVNVGDRALPKVFVARELLGDGVARLKTIADVEVWPKSSPPTPAELVEHAESADALLSMLTERIDDAFLDACPALRVVSNMAVGYYNFDLGALTRHGVPASNTPDVLTDATADLTLALLLATTRRIVEARDALLAGAWKTWSPTFMLGMELGASTLGIIGMGRIGQAVAQRALAFKMRVIAWSKTPRPIPGVEFVSLDELLATSDVVSLHVALNADTKHLIGAAELDAMKQTAILLNTSRGPVVDQVALAAALSDGRIGGAGLDVFESEPVSLDDPIVHAPNCVVLPHIGSATFTTRTAMASVAVDNIVAGLRGEPLPNCVNPEVYQRS